MMKNNTNLVSSAKVYQENQYAEFTTLFRIPFKESDGTALERITPSEIIEAFKIKRETESQGALYAS